MMIIQLLLKQTFNITQTYQAFYIFYNQSQLTENAIICLGLVPRWNRNLDTSSGIGTFSLGNDVNYVQLEMLLKSPCCPTSTCKYSPRLKFNSTM